MSYSKTTWTQITPPGVNLDPNNYPSFGVVWVAVAPSNNRIVYCLIDSHALYKSVDGGRTWAVNGPFDSPFQMRIDPSDPQHAYLTQGVRGTTLGFFRTTNGGSTWTTPAGFSSAIAITGTNDITTLAVDPSNFNHLFIGSHQAWSGLSLSNAGFLESTDGGSNWTIRNPHSTWPAGTTSLNFLYDLKSGQGNSSTLLAGTDGNGMWRTTDNCVNWTQVTTNNIPHGGQSIYYGSDGRVYAGAAGKPLVSSDNGVTWAPLSNLQNWYYYTIGGDGKHLYTGLAYTGGNLFGSSQPYVTSLETDGINWTNFQSGAQTFTDGPYNMVYAPQSGVMYSANWAAGLWALQIYETVEAYSVQGFSG